MAKGDLKSHDGAKSPYLVALTSLPGNPGKTLELEDYVLPLDPAWTNGVVQLSQKEGTFQVSLQALHDGILATVTGSVETEAQCSRCLDPVPGTIDLYETQMFFFPGAREAARAEGDEEWEDLLEVSEENDIDLEPVLRDSLVLEMETLPLCKPDCQGLCPGCGQRWEDLPEDHTHEVIDPRWAALGDLAKQLQEEAAGEEKPGE